MVSKFTRKGGGVPARFVGALVDDEATLKLCVLALAWEALEMPDGTSIIVSFSELLLLPLCGLGPVVVFVVSTQPSAARNTASHVATCSGAPVMGLCLMIKPQREQHSPAVAFDLPRSSPPEPPDDCRMAACAVANAGSSISKPDAVVALGDDCVRESMPGRGGTLNCSVGADVDL